MGISESEEGSEDDEPLSMSLAMGEPDLELKKQRRKEIVG